VVRRSAGDNQLVDVGAITTASSTAAPERLQELHRSLTALIDRHRPESAAVEQLFFGSNTTTAMRVSEARGVILLALQQSGVETWEYTPAQVKTSLTGYGKADKAQMTKMVRAVLELPDGLSDDAFDAVAIALCHLQSKRMLPGRKIS
jgi:crossover junction endodeoxyribonuclease RuvC